MKTNKLGPLDETHCPHCGKRHHQYFWPQVCLEAAEKQDRKAEAAFDAKALKGMSKVERDAFLNR